MRVKLMLKLTLKLAPLVSSNGADSNPAGVMYSAIIFLSAAAASLFFFRNQTILKREKSSTHIITYLLPPRLVAGMLPPRSTNTCSTRREGLRIVPRGSMYVQENRRRRSRDRYCGIRRRNTAGEQNKGG